MINNSQDTRFWTQTAADGHFKCDDLTCATPNSTWNDDTSPSDTDWTCPIIDDDPYDKFCTAHANADGESETFACSAIKCIMERKFDTTYTDDFRFLADTVTSATGLFAVAIGNLRLGINPVDSTGEAADTGNADTAYLTNTNALSLAFTANAFYGMSFASAAIGSLLAATLY